MTSLLFACLLIGLQPTAAQIPAPGAQLPTHKASIDYVVGPQDALRVTVFGVADLTRDVTVDNDGTFDFPLIGRVKAGGMTVRQIEDQIRTALADRKLLTNPAVTVDVTAYRSQTVYIMGEVRNVGRTTLSANQSILSVLAEAGFLPTAGSEIIISHRPPGVTAEGPILPDQNPSDLIRISRKDLEFGRGQNIRLQDGDTIFVPKAEQFFITGEVRSPGFYPLDRELTVLQALALAGGATERASKGGIKADRVIAGKTKSVKLKLSDRVLPGDNITVPRRIF